MRDFKGDQGDWALRPRAASERAGRSSWWRRPNDQVAFVRYGCPPRIREHGWQTSAEMCGNLPFWGFPHRERLTLPDAEESVRASGGGPGAQCEGEDRCQPPGECTATPIPSGAKAALPLAWEIISRARAPIPLAPEIISRARAPLHVAWEIISRARAPLPLAWEIIFRAKAPPHLGAGTTLIVPGSVHLDG
jgi:hypothetical protein